MKNILTILTMTAALLIGMNSVSAQKLTQDNSRPEVIAKKESAEITETLGLNGDQSRAVFRALVAREVSYRKSGDGNSNTATSNTEKQKADATLKETMKKILTEKQYAEWEKTYNK